MRTQSRSRPAPRSYWIVENFLLVPLIAAVVLGVCYWAFVWDRQPPVDLYDGRVEPSSAAEFQTVNVEWQVRIIRRGPFVAHVVRQISPSIDATRAWRIVDEQTTRTMGTTPALEPRAFQVPRGFQWGPTVYRASVCYEMRGLSLTQIWPVCVRWPELPFEIVPPA